MELLRRGIIGKLTSIKIEITTPNCYLKREAQSLAKFGFKQIIVGSLGSEVLLSLLCKSRKERCNFQMWNETVNNKIH